jgi:hypothetical protein
MPWRLLLWAGLVGLLCACEGGEKVIPTNPPVVPVLSATPTETLSVMVATPDPRTPTPDVSLPTWTPLPSDTPRATRTAAPSSTPAPSTTPLTQLEAGLETFPDGKQVLTLSEAELTQQLVNLRMSVDLEADQLLLIVRIRNEFLEQDSLVRARLRPEASAGELRITLVEYRSEGPTVTREQVQETVTELQAELTDTIEAAYESTDLTYRNVRLLPDFLQIEAEAGR